MLNLKIWTKPVDRLIQNQEQTIEDQKKILEYMEKELERLKKLKAWGEENGADN